jgi:hypothetical protein
MTKWSFTFRIALFGLMLFVGDAGVALPPQNANGLRPAQTVAESLGTEKNPHVVKQTFSDADQRGTDQQPLVVKSIPASKPIAETRNEQAAESRHASNEWLTARSTLGLAIVTSILAFFTYRLWDANKTLIMSAENTAGRQSREMQASIAEANRAATAMENVANATRADATLMQDILHKQMRAYVAVNIGAATYQDENLKYASNPMILNTGFTPAKNVSSRVTAAILDTKLAADYKFDDSAEMLLNDATLSPRQSFVILGVVKDRFEAEEVAAIMKGDVRRLYVWGTVNYEDVFGGSWETRFCHHFVFYRVRDEVKVNSWYHTTHNSTT